MQRVLLCPLPAYSAAILKTKWHKNGITQKGIYLVYLLYISSHNCQVFVVVVAVSLLLAGSQACA